jgi:hypothetical protein
MQGGDPGRIETHRQLVGPVARTLLVVDRQARHQVAIAFIAATNADIRERLGPSGGNPCRLPRSCEPRQACAG